MKDDFKKLTEQVKAFAKENLKESRYLHSLRVADYAKHLAELYPNENVAPETAYFAGLSHDICKNYSDEDLVKTVEKDGMGVDEVEKTRLNLLHGRAAAIVLKENFSVENEAVLKAVGFHTFGYEEIDALGKIVYIADKIEPERPNTQDFRDFAFKASLNELMLKVLEWNMNYIKQKGAKSHPLTDKMHKKLKADLMSERKDMKNEN